ncbi:MAG: FG-GAP-like repeat-containing protein [Candidatus Heimdallarchaeaceae archaeon]
MYKKRDKLLIFVIIIVLTMVPFVIQFHKMQNNISRKIDDLSASQIKPLSHQMTKNIGTEDSISLFSLWNKTIEEDTHSTLIPYIYIADINRDYKPEIVVLDYYSVYSLSLDGEVIDSYTLKTQYGDFWIFAIGDIDNDGNIEIVTEGGEGDVSVISFQDNRLNLEWRTEVSQNVWDRYKDPVQMLLADLDRDGKMEIITINSRLIYCLNYKGEILWSIEEEVSRIITGRYFWCYEGATVANINSDEYLELIISLYCTNRVMYINKDGDVITELWEMGDGKSYPVNPIITDLDNDGNQELIIAKSAMLQVFDPETRKMQSLVPLNISVYVDCICVCANINQDAEKEIILTAENQTMCFSAQGKLLWKIAVEKPISSEPLIADINGDGLKEIILVSSDGKRIYVLNSEGELLSEFATQNQIFGIPCIIDINNDGKMEIIGTTKERVVCYGIQGINVSGEAGWWCKYNTPLGSPTTDTDGDYLDDLSEMDYYNTNYTVTDTDKDGLIDGKEILFYHSNPLINDTDGDKLSDYEEINKYYTAPDNIDTDYDGLNDYDELFLYKTSPTSADSDKDGMLDGFEIKNHFSPLKWDNWPLFWHKIPFLPIIVAFIGLCIFLYLKYKPIMPKIIIAVKKTKEAIITIYFWVNAQILQSSRQKIRKVELDYLNKYYKKI